tara:strand:- start:436 stop:1107 length:672 start_codon:yes stop_codon:yes gene_type:complete
MTELKLRERYSIRKIDYRTAMDLVIKNHYLHRKAPCSVAFGLFEKTKETSDLFSNERVVGVVVYGVSCSSTLLKGICGESEKRNVYELTRLWIEDGTPKNTESYLIGNTLRLLDKEIIVSFAEIQQGHVGTVYQATNFLYCGLSAKFRDPKVKGLEHQHHATYANRMTMAQVREKYGDENVYYVDRPRKHRYIYFNAKTKRKKELIGKLKYEILDYPKKDSKI